MGVFGRWIYPQNYVVLKGRLSQAGGVLRGGVGTLSPEAHSREENKPCGFGVRACDSNLGKFGSRAKRGEIQTSDDV